MAQSEFTFPTIEALATGLSEVFQGNGRTGRPVVIRRTPIMREARGRYFVSESLTFPAEVVTCSFADHQEVTLFCKYQEDGCDHNSYGHRGGVIYEAEVYRALLQGLPVRTPKFYGTFQSADRRRVWLILEFIDRALLLHDVPDERSGDLPLGAQENPQPTALGLAARWVGRFHALTAERVTQRPLAFLNRYDQKYYLGWADRTCEFAGQLHRDYPWLEGVCRRAEHLLNPLFVAPPAVIHGEYYDMNILCRERTVYPVDWESAAVAAGEIDLAAVTEGRGWSPDLVQHSIAEYKRARWPRGAPLEFPSTFAAARTYLHLRWLGERRYWTLPERKWRWRFDQLAEIARQLGLA